MLIRGIPAPFVRRASGRAGFSLLELVVTITIIGLVAAVGVSLLADDPGSARSAKLDSDVSTLNQMVALYVADGGSLAGLTTPQSVIDKMKRVRPKEEWQQHVGMASGRLLDVRLRARMTTRPDDDDTPRATWNRAKMRFELTKATGSAVSEFYLDESLAGTDFGTETRAKTVVTFNSDTKGWVWNTSGTNAQAAYLNPQGLNPPSALGNFDPDEAMPESSEPPTADPGGDGGGGGGGEPALPTLIKLPRPLIMPVGGTFAYLSFPANASISSNGAPAGASRLMYSVNGGGWTPYTGASIPLTPAMTIQAMNETTRPAEFSTSSINSQTYYRLASGFSGTGDGTWGNAVGGTNLVTNISNDGPNGSATFKHGNTKLDLGNGEYLDAGVENVLTFTPQDFDTIVPNTWFTFGDLTMLNGTTFYESEATGATLSVDLTMTQPALKFTTHIDLGFISTANTSDRLASADAVVLKNPTTEMTINIDGVEYRLELSWETLDPGAGVVQGNKFLIFEGATAQARLRARFTSNR